MRSCCSLRLTTAGIVVGLFYSVVSLFITALGIEYLIDFLFNENIEKSPWLIASTFLIVLFGVASLISSILLVLGTFKKRHRLIIPWLTIDLVIIIFIFLILLNSIYELFDIIIHKSRLDYSTVITILIIIILTALQIYLWKSILHLYKDIKTENEQQQIDDMFRNAHPLYPTLNDFSKMTEIELN